MLPISLNSYHYSPIASDLTLMGYSDFALPWETVSFVPLIYCNNFDHV